ncbi:hypothetical protein EPI10_006133 [Gossypium australe]|uniref:Uncharacterized protein n=1 Tax=Gossypium australe TaxID=47621 RepID=A0A5B6WQC0_9ROSI|nr:hypothetical protein EPI10_006133 [Gossypium australe]
MYKTNNLLARSVFSIMNTKIHVPLDGPEGNTKESANIQGKKSHNLVYRNYALKTRPTVHHSTPEGPHEVLSPKRFGESVLPQLLGRYCQSTLYSIQAHCY